MVVLMFDEWFSIVVMIEDLTAFMATKALSLRVLWQNALERRDR